MNEKDKLIKEAEHILEFYGEPTVAADFAREVLQFLQTDDPAKKDSESE